MVDDLLEDLVVHLGEYDDLEEGLDGSQHVIGVRPHLVNHDFADALLRANVVTALLLSFFLLLGHLRLFLLAFLALLRLLLDTLLDQDVVTLKIFVLFYLVELLLVPNVDARNQGVFNVYHNRLEATVDLILLDLLL